MKRINKKDALIIILSIIFSIVSGILTHDLIIGGTILLTSLLCTYFASKVADKEIIIPNGGHLNSESGYEKFEELLEYIK